MVSQENLKYVCISGNIFVNTQSILKILAPKRKVFNDEYTHRNTLLQYQYIPPSPKLPIQNFDTTIS